MASPARRLSTKQLIKFLDIDDNFGDFVDIHAGNEANLAALFDRIAELKEKSPADYERLNAAAAGVENPDDMVDAIGREIYPPVKTGIRNKDPDAPQAPEQRAGAATDAADAATLPATPEPSAEPAPAAKRGRGRPRKAPAAAPLAEPAALPAAPAATLPEGGVGYLGGPSTSDVVSSGGAMPGTGSGAVGAFGESVSLPGASPLSEPPKFNPFAGIDWSKYGGSGTPPPGPSSMPDASPSGMSADDQINALSALLYSGNPSEVPPPPTGIGQDDAEIPDFREVPPPPEPNLESTKGMSFGELQNALDAQPWGGASPLTPEDMSPPPNVDATSGMSFSDLQAALDEQPFGGASPLDGQASPDAVDAPWQPVNSRAANFFKAMGAPGMERYGTVFTSPADGLANFVANHPRMTAAIGAGALGYAAMNQAPPSPNAVTPEQAEQDKQALIDARRRLSESSRRGRPAVIPER